MAETFKMEARITWIQAWIVIFNTNPLKFIECVVKTKVKPVKLKVNFVFYRTNRKFQSWGKSDESKFCLSNIKFKSTVSWTWPSTAKSRTTLAFTHACTASAGLYGLDGGTFSAFNGDGNICQPFYYLSQYLNNAKKFYLRLKSFFYRFFNCSKLRK